MGVEYAEKKASSIICYFQPSCFSKIPGEHTVHAICELRTSNMTFCVGEHSIEDDMVHVGTCTNARNFIFPRPNAIRQLV